MLPKNRDRFWPAGLSPVTTGQSAAMTVDSVKDWGSGSLIIWNGHGNYTDTFKESFMTGEAYTQSADQKYRSDLDQDG